MMVRTNLVIRWEEILILKDSTPRHPILQRLVDTFLHDSTPEFCPCGAESLLLSTVALPECCARLVSCVEGRQRARHPRTRTTCPLV